jgi:hypothetical protein
MPNGTRWRHSERLLSPTGGNNWIVCYDIHLQPQIFDLATFGSPGPRKFGRTSHQAHTLNRENTDSALVGSAGLFPGSVSAPEHDARGDYSTFVTCHGRKGAQQRVNFLSHIGAWMIFHVGTIDVRPVKSLRQAFACSPRISLSSQMRGESRIEWCNLGFFFQK